MSDRIELLRIRVEAFRGEARFNLEALVTWSGNASSATVPQEESDSRAMEVEESQPTTARQARDQARGQTRTEASSVAKLNYPFRFFHLSENRRI